MPTQTHPLAFLLAYLADVSLSVAMPVSILILWRIAIGPLGVAESVVCVVVGLVGYVFARGVVLPRRLFVSREVDDAPKRPPPP
ncbi:hypothetical protein NDI76_17210 [Halogeometricum sp. S1BR25-6]|uniref:Uncharacterized protein n=1 Tax=Halogeometricum salsisoli TaxID=2950536 RepID=A0ABU2GI50_9EURY|nr:hypothetical protein [Halogeometricum sp. S1BR25-6]MDS0300490.1 hypothetical protein [Halogeometricum sp. S1BR25-6]